MQSGVYSTMSVFVVIFITLFILFWFNKAGFSDGITISLGAASFILLPPILFTIDSKKNKKAEKLFSKKFPHYAEIIKKVESADA